MNAHDSTWRRGALRSALLFLNFFLIMLAYYQVKPASRSLFLEHVGADNLPYVWTASGLLLMLMLPPYQKLLQRFDRIRIVQGTAALVIALLLYFRFLMNDAGLLSASAFYVLVDIFSVVLVEQFWSLTNSVHDREEGQRWYGLIACGGLVGGLAGGMLASWIVRLPGIATVDLLMVSASLLLIMMWLTSWLDTLGVYSRVRRTGDQAMPEMPATAAVWNSVRGSRFLSLLALLVLFSQICEPIVEFQFMHVAADEYRDAEARTVFLSDFLGLLSGVGLAVNLLLTPLVHRAFGLLGGLLMQPLLLGCSAISFALHTDLRGAGFMKIADRGLAYSINRSSRELVYVSADPHTIFRVKAWIDMVGYRAFKIVGNVAILLVTQLLPWSISSVVLAGAVLVICVAWTACVLGLKPYLAGEDEPARGVTAT
jgi:AAA family ATP:ADP antiporter